MRRTPVSPGGLFLVPATGLAKAARGGPAPKEVDPRLEALMTELCDEYQPRGLSETAIVRQMASARWRAEYSAALSAGLPEGAKRLQALELYAAASERAFRQAEKSLRMLRNSRPRPKLVRLPKTTGGY